MKASIFTEYGPPEVLHIAEIERPVPKANEVLIKVAATSVLYGDALVRNLGNRTLAEFNMPALLWPLSKLYFGYSRPKRGLLGAELSGVIEEVGADVTKFKFGDEIFAYAGQAMGAYAEYICMADDSAIAHKPENLSMVEAANIPYGGIMATSLLKKAPIELGDKVLVNGASGGIGATMVQLLKRHYSTEVHGVGSASRLDYIRALGADRAIDYRAEDFTQNGEKYNLIIDVLGRSSFRKVNGSLTDNGTYFLASFKMKPVLQTWRSKYFGSKKVLATFGSDKQADLLEAKAHIESGAIRPIVDRSFTLETAAEAHQYYESAERAGAVAIMVNGDQSNESN